MGIVESTELISTMSPAISSWAPRCCLPPFLFLYCTYLISLLFVNEKFLCNLIKSFFNNLLPKFTVILVKLPLISSKNKQIQLVPCLCSSEKAIGTCIKDENVLKAFNYFISTDVDNVCERFSQLSKMRSAGKRYLPDTKPKSSGMGALKAFSKPVGF